MFVINSLCFFFNLIARCIFQNVEASNVPDFNNAAAFIKENLHACFFIIQNPSFMKYLFI